MTIATLGPVPAGASPEASATGAPTDNAAFRAALRAAEVAEQQRRAQRATPRSQAARANSRTAHSGLAADAAVGLARRTFPRVLADAVWQPLPAEATVSEYVDDHWARIDLPGQPGMLVQSSAPLRVTKDGAPTPVDLGLVATGSGLRSENPIVGVTYAGRSTTPARLDRSGIGVRMDGARDVVARVEGDRAYYPGVATDTDQVVVPTSTGFEVLWQLRSAASPETLSLRFDLPDGASLRMATGTDAAGAAEVVRGTERLALVAPPVAAGADGEPLAVRYTAAGNVLTVHAPHAAADTAYPVLVDPQVTEWWSGGDWHGSDGWWAAERLIGGPHSFSFARNFQRYGVQVGAYQWATYYDTSSAGWSWTAPADTYIAAGQFSELRSVSDSSTLVTGIYRPNVWESAPAIYGGDFDGWGAWHSAGAPTDGNNAYVGLSMIGSHQRLRGALASMSSVSLVMGDRWTPDITIEDAWPNEGWTNAAQASVKYRVQDRGLGLKSVGVTQVGNEPSANGTGGPWLSAVVNQSCTGNRRTPCPLYHDSRGFGTDGRLPYNLSLLPEGISNLHLRAHEIFGDASGRVSYSDSDVAPQRAWQARVDRAGPAIALSGDMFTRRSESRMDSSFALRVDATDGSTASNATRRSGAKRVQVFVDNELRSDTGTTTCATDSCALGVNYTLNTNQLDYIDGSHEVRVVAEDHVGNSTTSTFEFFVTVVGRELDAMQEGDGNSEEPSWGPTDTSVECYCTEEELANTTTRDAMLETPIIEGASDPTATTAAATRFAWGISDQNAPWRLGAGDARLQKYDDLGVRNARFQMAYDTFSTRGSTVDPAHPDQCVKPPSGSSDTLDNCKTRAEFRLWLASVKARGMTPLVSFQKRRGARYVNTVPTESTYRAGVRAFFTEFNKGEVKHFTSWNEPNLIRRNKRGNLIVRDPLSYRPELAARLYAILRWECDRPGRNCTVGAGEYIDDGNMRSYHLSYKAELQRIKNDPSSYPSMSGKVFHWAMHAYWTGNHHNSGRLRQLRDNTPANTNIWLTEQNGVINSLSINQDCSTANPAICTAANGDLQYLLKLPGAHQRISRFFAYQFYVPAPPGWDSALIDYNGNVRDMYNTFKARPNP